MRFSDLLEQDQLRRALTEDLSSGAFSHAYLITGPSGSGKRTWGRVLACALLCRERRGAEPCGNCITCRSFSAGSCPALFSLEPENRKIKTEQIREIRGQFYFEGMNRVCLICRAEQMTAEAASSLLKILEDPPPGLYFILLAEQAQQLHSTIVSRCRRYSMQPLTAGAIESILQQQGISQPGTTGLAVRLSKGLPGLALAIAQDPSYEIRLREAGDLSASLAAGKFKPREIIGQAAALSEREDLFSLLENVYLYYRDWLIWQLCRSESLLINPAQHNHSFKNISPRLLETVLEIIHETLKELMFTNVNRRLAVERMLIEIQRRYLYAQSDRCAFPASR
jgi:DNA polymerase-3 subunit delta'